MKFDVVDGQQRIRAICEFRDGKYGLSKDAEAIDGNPFAGVKYQELSFDLRIKWDTYDLDVVVMDEVAEDETREVCLRLQNGTFLTARGVSPDA